MSAAASSEPAFFELDAVRKTFGGLVAVNGVSVRVERGSVVAMIGPNGAGKSTVFNLISGIYALSSGAVRFRGQDLAGKRTDAITRLGIARTFQNIRLFSFMSALDNVMAGRHVRMKTNLLGSLLHTPGQRAEERSSLEASRELLAFVGLEGDAQSYARNLPYGSQRRLEIARALASGPELLLLDEPAAGMNPKEKGDLVGLIGRIRERGVTVFLIEHDMQLVMAVSERITVLDHGEKIAEGTPAEVRADARVIEAYLGAESPAS